MFKLLQQINDRPEAFEFYTTKELWTRKHTAKKMLECHLNGSVDMASYRFSFIDKSVNWIASYFNLTEKTKIADFGCGPGLYTIRLAEKGVRVTGIDFSANSLEYAIKQAKKNLLEINYINQNYLEYNTNEKFDLIVMIMFDFCALSPAQRKLLLGKFYNFLNPGGHVLLDVESLLKYDKIKESASYTQSQRNGFWSDKEYYEFLNVFKYDKKKVSLNKFTIIEESRMFTIYVWFQYLSTKACAAEFEEAGFQVKEFFGDVAGTPFSENKEKFAIVAQKK